MDGAINHDLEKRVKQLEKELEEVRRQNHLIPGYLSAMSHDIRTPLNSILGFSSLLTETDWEADELGFYAQMISRSSKKLLETINNLIDYAKIETGNLKVATEMVDISDLFEEIKVELEEDRHLFGKDEIKLSFSAPHNGSGLIQADRHKLHQILRIFLDNSLKFTRSGEIQLICTIQQPHAMIFSIRDTGIGMDYTTRNSLFTMFLEQNKGANKIKTRGLGMLVANGLIDLMKGQLDVNSEPQIGTTISVTLPHG